MDAVTSWNAGGASREKVDFVVGDVLGDGAYRAVQVCAAMESEKTRRRELRGLSSAMAVFGMNFGEIITLDQEETITVDTGEVRVVPAWRWLLQ